MGLGLSAQLAVAAQLEQQAAAPITSSSTVLSATTVDQFTLPSYESSKGLSVIDLTDEVQDVNKKTMAAAKAKREASDALTLPTYGAAINDFLLHCNLTDLLN